MGKKSMLPKTKIFEVQIGNPKGRKEPDAWQPTKYKLQGTCKEPQVPIFQGSPTGPKGGPKGHGKSSFGEHKIRMD